MLVGFDLLQHDGADLRDLPLIERKQRLARLLGRGKRPAAST
jgi:ATP-dependent DNA ligase